MKKILITICLTTFYSVLIIAQPSIKIEKEAFDFGELKEGETATHEFLFTNNGKEPLLIANVQPSCGCTIPEWSKEPVAPGAAGKIKAMYNTKGRVGFFNKSITVTTNGDPASVTLFIKGSVVAEEEKAKKFTDAELKLSPKIVLDKPLHHFGKAEKGAKLTYKLGLKNLGRSDLRITGISSPCNCVTFNSKQEYVKSGESGLMEIIYSPTGKGDTEDIIYIGTNDISNPKQKFTLQAKIVDGLTQNSPLKENNANVPFR